MSEKLDSPVKWGEIGYITYARTYSREKKDGTKETFSETVERELKGIDRQLKLSFTDKEKEFYRKMRHEMKGSVAGRFMWQLGTKTVDKLGLASLQNCFGRETEFMTDEGIKSFKDFEHGDEVIIRGKLGWKAATVLNFGQNDLVKLNLRKGKRTKTIRTTLNHRWILKDGTIKTTEQLIEGEKLSSFESHLFLKNLRMCKVATQHGIVFGDGHKISNGTSTAWTKVGDSIEETEVWFDPTDSKTVSGLPYFYKDLPDMKKANNHYLYGFLAGWFLADGSIGTNGSNITLSNKSEEVLIWAKGAFSKLGVSTSEVNIARKQSPFDGSSKPLYRITIDRENLPKDFFLLSKHKERFKKPSNLSEWTVEYINYSLETEEVWCVSEPENEEFTLECGVLTKNCAFTVIDHPIRPFTWAMDMLMLGSGVGYSIKREHVYKLPKIQRKKVIIERQDNKSADFIVPDTREGWVKLLGKVLKSHFYSGEGFSYSVQLVRGKGELIEGFGGVASGAAILVEGMELISNVLNERRGKQLRPIDCLDIMNIIGMIVVAGNVRRSAQIAIGDYDDIEYLRAKRWDLGSIPNWRAMSNNSVDCYDANLLPQEFWDTYEQGEPYGLINLELSRREGRLGEIEYQDPDIQGFNPCFSSDTLICTTNGLERIETLVGKEVTIFSNNEEVTINNFNITGYNEQLLKITLYDGSELKVTPYHTMILNNGDRLEAKDLKVNDELLLSNIETNGDISIKGAYIKGFLCGDGTTNKKETPLLYLYEPKYVCKSKLVSSLLELPVIKNYNGLTVLEPDFVKQRSKNKDRLSLRGLTARDEDLHLWAKEYKLNLPDEVYLWNKQSKLDFIAGLFDADGTSSDTENGFMYQISSIYKSFLLDLQTLLKTIGVQSKISLMRKKGITDFNDGYGAYETKECFRLTVSQESAIKLSKQINFERLISFENREVKHNFKTKRNRIVSVEIEVKRADKVYCCTVPDTHSLSVGIGLEVGQCAEQGLANFETCCLAEVFLPNIDSEEELKEVVSILYKVNKHSLILKSHNKETEEIVHKNMRMGIGMTGIMMSSKEQLSWLSPTYNYLRELDKTYSKEHGFPESIKLTTVKPSGTLSLLAGLTAGVHPATAGQYYIRRIRISSESNLIEICKSHGYHIEFQKNFDGTEDRSTTVVEFPCKYPDGVVDAEELDVLDQLEMVKFMQTNWSDNSVSVTAYYNKEDLPRIKEYIIKNFGNNFKTLSFLLNTGHGFVQAPYERITKDQYEYLSSLVKPINSVDINEDDIEELGACGIGGCPIK